MGTSKAAEMTSKEMKPCGCGCGAAAVSESTETCRYTGKPMVTCDCPDGCETNHMEAGEWVQPVTDGYRMECCDCGLVHLLDFRIHEGNIQFRAFREHREQTPLEIERASEMVQASNRIATKADYGCASFEEISDGFRVAMSIADTIKGIPNPAVQNMVKELIALIRTAPPVAERNSHDRL